MWNSTYLLRSFRCRYRTSFKRHKGTVLIQLYVSLIFLIFRKGKRKSILKWLTSISKKSLLIKIHTTLRSMSKHICSKRIFIIYYNLRLVTWKIFTEWTLSDIISPNSDLICETFEPLLRFSRFHLSKVLCNTIRKIILTGM